MNRRLIPHLYKYDNRYQTGEAINILIKERNDYKVLAQEYIEKYFELLNNTVHHLNCDGWGEGRK